MQSNHAFKRTAIAIALAAFVWTGTTWPTSTVSAAPIFSDIKGHWAEKDMVKLALQNLFKGSDGKFEPNKSIRREDAVIVALKFMGHADNLSVTGSITFPSSFQVDNYAKPYIVEAFKQKILLADEEYTLANQEKGKNWGQTFASREWVTRLLVRAIGKDAEAAANAGKATAFADNGSMDAKLRPYVLTAVQQGLVSGVTPTEFKPKSQITRAAIAKLFSKAQSKVNVAYSGQVFGTLIAASNGKVSLLLSNGTIVDYTLTSDSMITRYDSDKAVAAAALKLYSRITLIQASDGSAGYVEQLDDKSYVKSLEGTLTRVHKDSPKLSLLVGDEILSYTFDPGRLPLVTDAQGKALELKDIPEGAVVSLIMDTVRAEPKILAVTVKQSVINKTGTGTVTAWNSTSGTVEVTDAAGAKETLNVASAATFKREDTYVNREDLKVGDVISYEVRASVVVSIQMAKPAQTVITGIYEKFDSDSKSILYKLDGKLNVQPVAAIASVTVSGLQDAGWGDLQKGDSVTLTLNANGEVSQVTVNGRTVQTLLGATVEGYVAGTKTLSLKDTAGNPYNLFLVPTVRYDLNGTKLTAENALPLISTPGKKLTVGYSGQNAVFISIVGQYTGTVLENNTTSKTLRLQVGANTLTLPYTYPAVEIYGQSSASFTQVAPGDQVTVLLSGAQDQAATIQVHKRVQFEVVSVDSSALKLRTQKVGSAVVEEWTLPSNVVLQDENGAAKPLSQFTAGSLVNVTMQGRTPGQIQIARMALGKVVSVNTADSTVNIALSNGSTVTKSVGVSPVIIRDSAASGSLTSILPDDRVEIRKDENDRIMIEVIPVLRKYFWRYDAASGSVDVKRSTLTENYTYSLDAQVYIHQGTAAVRPADLKDDDVISLYILRGKVVEIAK